MDEDDLDLGDERDARAGLASRFTRTGDAVAHGVHRDYVAWDQATRREVLVRELCFPDGTGPLKRRIHEVAFLREGRILASLEHPAIPVVHELGRRMSGELFVVLRPMQGESFRDVLERTPRDERLGLLAAVVEVCRAVAHAHKRLVGHFDLRPENVRLTTDGEVRLVGWSQARRLSDPRSLQPDVEALAAMLSEVLADARSAVDLTGAVQRAVGAPNSSAGELVRVLQAHTSAPARKKWTPPWLSSRG